MKKFKLGKYLVGKSSGSDLPGHINNKKRKEEKEKATDLEEYMDAMKGFFPPGVCYEE